MKKAFALLLCAVLSLSMLSACGGSTQNTTEETAETEIRLDACGLAYTIPQSWTTEENVNLIPTSYAQPEDSVYAVVCYDYAPDENMEALNDTSSTVPVDELMAPLVEFLVVRDGQETADSAVAEFNKFNSKQELPKQDGFRFYFLTDPSTGIDHLSKDAQEVYKTLAEDLPTLYKSVETFQPDEASVAEQASKQGELFGFISTDLEGNAIDSSIFADYDLTAVNFFASYSYPDINELKELESYYQTLQAEYPNVNFVQVIIDTPGNEAEAKILAAYEENGVTFTGIMPDKAMASWIVDNLKGLPTTIFIDKDGRIQGDRIEGKQSADQYLEATKEMLDNL